ncbi:hypothetical protein Tco_1274864 [Tanacetum coccineum]
MHESHKSKFSIHHGSEISKSSPDAGFKPSRDDEKKVTREPGKEGGDSSKDSECSDQEKEDNVNSTNNVNAASTNEVNVVGRKSSIKLPDDPNMPELEDIVYSDDDEDVGAEADMNNLDAFMPVSPILTTRVHKDHRVEQIIGDLNSAPITRRRIKNLEEHEEPKKVIHALNDLSWIEAMQDVLLQFKLQKVWTLVDLPNGKRAIGTKWVYRNKKDEREMCDKNRQSDLVSKRIERIYELKNRKRAVCDKNRQSDLVSKRIERICDPGQIPLGQMILFGAIPAIIPVIPEVPIILADLIVAPDVGTVSVILPTGVLDLVDYLSSSDSDPSEDSLPPAPDLPLVSPFLCSDDSEADGKSEPAEQRPKRHESLTPSFEFPLALAFRRWRSTPLSTPYPPTTSESSLGSSSERSLDSSLLSSRPSCRRCRSPTASIPSPTHVSRSIALTPTDLLPPRKRFRDSYSPEDSGEEHMEVDIANAEAVVDIGISDGVVAHTKDGVGMGVGIAASDVREDNKEFKAEASAADTREIIVDPLAIGDSFESSRGGIPNLEDTIYDIVHYMLEVRIDRITEIETTQRQLETSQLVASGERASLVKRIGRLRLKYLKVRRDRDVTQRRLRRLESTMTITRFGMTPEAIEEFVNRRVEEALATYEEARAANTFEAENQSQNGNDGDNGNGGNGNGGNGNPNENGRGDRPIARECTYQDHVKCQALNFKGTEGVVGLIRTIGTEATFAISWRELMKLMTEVYCQRMKSKRWNLSYGI